MLLSADTLLVQNGEAEKAKHLLKHYGHYSCYIDIVFNEILCIVCYVTLSTPADANGDSSVAHTYIGTQVRSSSIRMLLSNGCTKRDVSVRAFGVRTYGVARAREYRCMHVPDGRTRSSFGGSVNREPPRGTVFGCSFFVCSVCVCVPFTTCKPAVQCWCVAVVFVSTLLVRVLVRVHRARRQRRCILLCSRCHALQPLRWRRS